MSSFEYLLCSGAMWLKVFNYGLKSNDTYSGTRKKKYLNGRTHLHHAKVGEFNLKSVCVVQWPESTQDLIYSDNSCI